MFDSSNWKNLQNIYTSILKDIFENKNLEKHLDLAAKGVDWRAIEEKNSWNSYNEEISSNYTL